MLTLWDRVSPTPVAGCPLTATGLLALALLVVGCGGREPIGEAPPATMATLVGAIKPEATELAVGDELLVVYEIRNVSARPLSFDVADRDPDNPQRPFRGYSFNAARVDDRTQPLELLFVNADLLGQLTLPAGGGRTFARVRWRATAPGTYKLVFALEWRVREWIHFEPVEVRVGGGSPAPQVKPELVEAVAKQLQALSKATAETDADRKRRQAIREALLELGPDAAPLLVQGMAAQKPAQQTLLSGVLVAYGPKAAPALVSGCAHSEPSVRARAIYGLGELAQKHPAVAPSAAIALGNLARLDPVASLRTGALQVCAARLPRPLGLPIVLDGLADGTLEVRSEAGRAIARMAKGVKRPTPAPTFDPRAPLAARQKVIEAWRAWWTTPPVEKAPAKQDDPGKKGSGPAKKGSEPARKGSDPAKKGREPAKR